MYSRLDTHQGTQFRISTPTKKAAEFSRQPSLENFSGFAAEDGAPTAQNRDSRCRPCFSVALLVESELERYSCTVVQVNGVSVSVAGSQIASGHNELPSRGACTVQERAAHKSERAALWSRSV